MTTLPKIALGPLSEAGDELLLAAAFAGEAPRGEHLPAPVAEALAEIASRGGWHGRDGQVGHGRVGAAGPRVLLYGLGKRGAGAERRIDEWLRKGLTEAAREGEPRVAVLLPDEPWFAAAAAERLARGVVRGTYRFERFRTASDDQPEPLAAVRLVPAGGGCDAEALRVTEAVAGAVRLCRDLANTPANEATPAWMDERAAELAAAHGLTHTSLGPGELASRGMGGLLAVGAGSANEPRMVRLGYGDPGAGGGLHVALVGKGVTFDTGGISIKPASDMDEMKYDKCGACTALSVARAVAELGLPLRLSVFVALAENMPDGGSYRPGDIVRTYSGKTVEILNTDAEGRIILADALAWAAEERPDVLLEYSTLTGAAVVALGQDAAGLYTPDDRLADELLAAAGRTGERLWRMPLWPEFAERMKGDHADLKNVAGRWGGANTAAAFLAQFVDGLERWAHLDIAGGAYVGRGTDEEPGATGYGVAFTVDWLRRVVAERAGS